MHLGLLQAWGRGVSAPLCSKGGRAKQNENEETKDNRYKPRTGEAAHECFLLTSTLLSSDPALLRRPRFPAQNTQYQRLDTDTRPGRRRRGP